LNEVVEVFFPNVNITRFDGLVPLQRKTVKKDESKKQEAQQTNKEQKQEQNENKATKL